MKKPPLAFTNLLANGLMAMASLSPDRSRERSNMKTIRSIEAIRNREKKIAVFKVNVLKLLTDEFVHISALTRLALDNPGKVGWGGRKGRGGFVKDALDQLEKEGKAESMRDEYFPGTYWRLKK